jgi:Methyltransferase domain
MLLAAANLLGYDAVRRGFYSPIPDLAALPSEQPRSPMSGVDFDAERQIAYLRDQLGPFLDGLRIPEHGAPGELHLRNGFYEAADAEVLYATVRARRPARVLELGSGYSTMIIARALQDAGGGQHTVFDPYAGDDLDGLARIVRCSAAGMPAHEWNCLTAGDVLFVDTSHTVKMGSEVNHVVLDVLPALAARVAVHFHDVFLPWDYPCGYITELEAYWTEQYLLQAFLTMNRDYKILLALHAIGRLYPDEIARLIPSVIQGASPCAIWIERQ